MDIPMNEIIGIFAAILAVLGVLTNNRRLRVCFLIWLVSNALTGFIHANAGIWSLVVRDAIFFVLAIEGGIRESTQSWREVLLKLKSLGMNALELGVGDGALGFS